MIIYSEPKTSPGLTFQKTVAITSARRVYTGPKVSGCHPVLVTFENYADRSPNNRNTGDSAGAYCVRNIRKPTIMPGIFVGKLLNTAKPGYNLSPPK